MVQLHFAERKRSRHVSTSATGYNQSGPQGSINPITQRNSQIETTSKTMVDADTLFPFVQGMKRRGGLFEQSMTGISMYDLGCNMYSEEFTRHTNVLLNNYKLENNPVGGPLMYSLVHSGPLYLSGALGNVVPWDDLAITRETEIAWGLGTTAIARSRPNKPQVDLAVTIGELRSAGGIPTLVGSLFSRSMTVLQAFRNGGKEYLNVQFGWRPLVTDYVNLCKAVLASRELIEQYERDLRREIRRRYTYPDVSSVTHEFKTISQNTEFWLDSASPMGAANPNVLTYDSASRDNGSYIKRAVEKRWFSGAFRYFNADVHEHLSDLQKFEEHANLLLGTRIDPEVIWNLQPWSWLVDWFVNYGDVLGNISAIGFDRQVMHYGYLMRDWEIYEEWSVPTVWAKTGFFNNKSTNLNMQVSSSRTTKHKLRVNAFPFGFGLNPEAFNASQWAILASLGISRGK